MKLLELREETIVAKMKNGESLRSAEVMADFYTIGLARQYLTEKARLDQSGGKVADMLAERQKTMAEQDGAPTDLLP